MKQKQKKIKKTKMHLNETMTEKQERQKCVYVSIFLELLLTDKLHHYLPRNAIS